MAVEQVTKITCFKVSQDPIEIPFQAVSDLVSNSHYSNGGFRKLGVIAEVRARWHIGPGDAKEIVEATDRELGVMGKMTA